MKLQQAAQCLILIAAISHTACNARPVDRKAGPAVVRTLVSGEKIAAVTKEDVQQRAVFLGAADHLGSGVTAYRIVYNMPFPEGGSGPASGLLLVPDKRADSLTLVSYQHGTLGSKDQAPSLYSRRGREAYVVGTTIAALAKGYIVALPDYLGYGTSAAAFHPYIHRSTLASASLQLLRAVRDFAADQRIPVRHSILLAGYSEGGYATMALHKMIDEDAAGEFRVAASYPGAGPYDIASTALHVLQLDETTSPVFLMSYAWVTVTYNKMHGINAPLSAYFTADNIRAAEGIAAGDFSASSAAIDPNPAKLFRAEFRKSMADGTHQQMMTALKDNNVHDWKPSGKVTLYHSPDDQWVPFLNAESALKAMGAKGADVKLVRLAGDHGSRAAGMYFYLLLKELK